MMQFLAERRFNYIDVGTIGFSTTLMLTGSAAWALVVLVVGSVVSVVAERRAV